MNVDRILILAATAMIATAIATAVARRLNLGSTVALIAVGMVLGPHSPFPTLSALNGLQTVGDVGVALLLFSVGMDITPKSIWAMRGQLARLGSVQYLLVVALIAAPLALFRVMPWATALIVALGLAMSSDAIAFGTLQERGETGSPQGRAITVIQLFQTMIAIPILAVIPIISAAANAGNPRSYVADAAIMVSAMTAIYLALRFVLPLLLAMTARRLGSGAFGLVILSAVLAASAILDSLGVSMALGALLAGTVLSGSSFADQIKASVAPVKQILLGLFFVAMGMSIDFHADLKLGNELFFGLPLLLLLKFCVSYGMARWSGLTLRTAAAAGVLLIPCDEIAYVIFKSAHDRLLMSDDSYALCLSMISISFAISPLIVGLVLGLIERFPEKLSSPVRADVLGIGKKRVIVVGYGYIGRAICSFLDHAKTPYVAFDTDLDHIAVARDWGHHVRYGDATDPALMTTASFDDARLIVLATSRLDVTTRVLNTLRQFHPSATVVAAVQYLAERDQLFRLGARDVVALMPEGILQFGRHVLVSLQIPEPTIAQMIKGFRVDDFAVWRGVTAITTPPAVSTATHRP